MRTVTLLGLLACPLVAQDNKPLLRLEMDGPGALRREFLPTDFGSMLGSQDARAIWPEAWDHFNRAWYGEGEGRGFWSFDGRIRVLGYVDPGPPQRDRGVILLEPDGEWDLERVQGELADLLREASGRDARILTTAERNWETVYLDTPGTITIPRPYGQRLVSFFGNEDDMEWVIAEGLQTLGALPPAEPESRPFSLRLDLAQLAAMGDIGAPFNKEQLDEIYGLSSLRDLRVMVQTAGPRIQAEVSLDFGDAERGIFGGLMPESQGQPELLTVVPDDAAPWIIGRLRLDRVVRTMALLFAYGFGAPAGDPIAELRADLAMQLGFDVFDDFLAHFGDEVLVIHRPDPEVNLAALPRNPFDGTFIGMRVRDDDPLRANFPKLLEMMMGPGTGAEGEDHHGVQVHELSVLGSGDAHWALTPDLLLISFGDAGLELLHAVLDTQRTATDDRPLPPALARRMRLAPPGTNGMGVIDLPNVLQGGIPYLSLLFMPLDALDLPNVDAGLIPLLEKHNLETLAIFTGFQDNTWRLRLVW